MGGRALVALPVGTGKTCIAIHAAHRLCAYPWLIICPSGFRLGWQDELDKWLPGAGRDACVVRTGKDPIRGRIVIISYELAAKRAREIEQLNPQTVIVDEAHGIKGGEATQRGRAIVPICRRAKHCLLLTGTPIFNRPMELFAQLDALRHPALKSRHQFGVDFCDAHQVEIEVWDKAARKRVKRRVWDYSGVGDMRELHEFIKPVLIRRRKADVLGELPPLQRVRTIVDPVGKFSDVKKLLEICRSALHRTRGDVRAALKLIRDEQLAPEKTVMKTYGELGLAKAKLAVEWIAGNASAENPLVVYAHHLAAIATMVNGLRDTDLRTGVIKGDVDVDDRHEVVRAFQAGEIDVLFATIGAANSCYTLTRASEMLVTCLPWSPEICTQIEGRLHRMTQTRGVLIRYMIAAGTFDEILWRFVAAKSRTAGLAIDGDANAVAFRGRVEKGSEDYWAVLQHVLESAAAEIGQRKMFEAA